MPRVVVGLPLALAPIIIPPLMIALSIVFYGGWSPVTNALSDLGSPHAGVSSILFNLALLITGYMIVILAILYMARADVVEALILAATSFTVLLVAVFNVSYGIVHYISSVTLFLALAAYITYNMLRHHSSLLAALLTISVTAWALHLTQGIPRGAATPEIISLASAYICYTRYTLKRILGILLGRAQRDGSRLPGVLPLSGSSQHHN